MRVFLLSLFDEWCFGLRSLSATLRTQGHAVTLGHLRDYFSINDDAAECDPDGYHFPPPASVPAADFQALVSLVRQINPDLVGISLTSNYTGLAARVTRELRAVTQAPIAWGGIDPTANPDIAIESADIVCIGEGEEAVAELAQRMQAGRSYRDVRNLWVRENGQVYRNPLRPLLQDLDHLPWPDFRRDQAYYIHNGCAFRGALPEVSQMHTSYRLMAARGCPYSCTFCCNSLFRQLYGNRQYVRTRSVPNVLKEIRHTLQNHPCIEIIQFDDDVFGVKRQWLEEFAEAYPRAAGVPFCCYVHPNACTAERIALLKRAGVAYVIMGVQTGSHRMLRDYYGRTTWRDRVLRMACLLQEAGISLVIDLITWNALETEADQRETLELLLALPPYSQHPISRLGIYRNFPIARIMEESNARPPWFENRNITGSTETPEMRFWYAFFHLVEFKEELGKETIRSLADDPHLRRQPEIVESLVQALQNGKYLPGTKIRLSDQQAKLATELGRYKGSRAVRWYFHLKQILR